jgi:hypothetical protein
MERFRIRLSRRTKVAGSWSGLPNLDHRSHVLRCRCGMSNGGYEKRQHLAELVHRIGRNGSRAVFLVEFFSGGTQSLTDDVDSNTQFQILPILIRGVDRSFEGNS